jgi:hypothetical protein
MFMELAGMAHKNSRVDVHILIQGALELGSGPGMVQHRDEAVSNLKHSGYRILVLYCAMKENMFTNRGRSSVRLSVHA